MKIKFAHVSDCHLGAWRKESLNEIGYTAFNQMIDRIIEEQVDFLILSGDLFDISNPKVEVADVATKGLKRLADNNIPVYGIMGSHDFSPSNKSIIRLLISAGLYTNLFRGTITDSNTLQLYFTEDSKTKVKLTGIRARKNCLEIDDYNNLEKDLLEKEKGKKIFVLHTILSELKPEEYKDRESGPKSMLPQNFFYYAGGHIHRTIPEKLRDENLIINKNSEMRNRVIYSGSLFPTDFRELEKQQYGGFCIVSGDLDSEELEVEYIPLKIKDVLRIYVDANNKTLTQVNDIIDKEISRGGFEDKIIVFRIEGILSAGKSYEIQANEIYERIKEKGAYEALIYKSQLISEEYKQISIDYSLSNEEIEKKLIYEHSLKANIEGIEKKEIEQKIYQIMSALGRELKEGEAKKDYHAEMIKNFYQIFELDIEEGDS